MRNQTIYNHFLDDSFIQLGYICEDCGEENIIQVSGRFCCSVCEEELDFEPFYNSTGYPTNTILPCNRCIVSNPDLPEEFDPFLPDSVIDCILKRLNSPY